jgi:hypothetical protein
MNQQEQDDFATSVVMKFLLRFVLFMLALGAAFLALISQLEAAPRPSQWSLAGVASWAQPLTASGTELPTLPNASYTIGDLFIKYDSASGTIFRASGSAWLPLAPSASGGGASITLPLSQAQGGTGGNSSSTARTALDVYSKAESEALASGTGSGTGSGTVIASGSVLPATSTAEVGDLFLLTDSATTALYRVETNGATLTWRIVDKWSPDALDARINELIAAIGGSASPRGDALPDVDTMNPGDLFDLYIASISSFVTYHVTFDDYYTTEKIWRPVRGGFYALDIGAQEGYENDQYVGIYDGGPELWVLGPSVFAGDSLSLAANSSQCGSGGWNVSGDIWIDQVNHGSVCTNFLVASEALPLYRLVEVSTEHFGGVILATDSSQNVIGVSYVQHDLDWNVEIVPIGSETWIVTSGAALVQVPAGTLADDIHVGDLLWAGTDGKVVKAGTITTMADFRRIVGRCLAVGGDETNIFSLTMVLGR